MTDIREIVTARRIQRIELAPRASCTLHFVPAKSNSDKTLTQVVDASWIEKHRPAPKGYYVEYNDNTSSYLTNPQLDTREILRARRVREVEKAPRYFVEYSDGSSGYIYTPQPSTATPRTPETDETKDVLIRDIARTLSDISNNLDRIRKTLYRKLP